jgi:hypothetical protein
MSRNLWGATLAAGVALFLAPGAAAQGVPTYTIDFRMEGCTFASTGANPLFLSLTPGHWLKLEGYEGPNFVEVLITSTPETRTIPLTTARGTPMTVTARVIEEREWINAELVEVSRNWFARCVQTNDVYYLGEQVDIYQNGQIVSHDGSWTAGVFGALPGVVMPGTFMLGARYYQEYAGPARDRGENVAMGLRLTVPYGTFGNCVRVKETTPLEPGDVSTKSYCEGTGLVVDDVVQLVGRGLPL